MTLISKRVQTFICSEHLACVQTILVWIKTPQSMNDEKLRIENGKRLELSRMNNKLNKTNQSRDALSTLEVFRPSCMCSDHLGLDLNNSINEHSTPKFYATKEHKARS